MYPLMRVMAPRLGVRFMNLGYWPISYAKDKRIITFMNSVDNFDQYESYKAHIYLYEKALAMHPNYPFFEHFEILEVSCGQGYSLEWIERWHGPTKCVIGCDKVVTRNSNNIVYGDATHLPFVDESFDLVLNVEAAHLYSDYKKFFKECFRVMKSGGYFCYLDVRYPYEVELIQETAASLGFEENHFECCTDEVVEGLNYSARRYDQLLERAPIFIKLFKKSLRDTYCAPGTAAYERLRNKQRIYIAAMWAKK